MIPKSYLHTKKFTHHTQPSIYYSVNIQYSSTLLHSLYVTTQTLYITIYVINSIIMRPKTAGKGKGKPGTKGVLRGTAGGSKDKKGKGLKGKTKTGANKGHVSYLTKLVMLKLVNLPLTQWLALDVEFCLIKLFLPFLVRLIGQSVFLYSPQLSLCLQPASSHRQLSLECINNWGAD